MNMFTDDCRPFSVTYGNDQAVQASGILGQDVVHEGAERKVVVDRDLMK